MSFRVRSRPGLFAAARWPLLILLAVLLAACSSASPAADSQVSPLARATDTGRSPAAPTATLTSLPSPAPTATATLAPGQLVIVHTNDNWGETEPCGWGQNATGGFRRRATFIKEQQRANAEFLLLLDAGDALIGGGLLGDASQGQAIVAGMNLMGYDAMAIGPKELSLGIETLSQRLAEAEFPMLSANAVLSADQELLAQPYTILERGGHRIGIIGLTRTPKDPIPGFEVLGLQPALERYVPEVTEQADTVIVLTNARYRAAMKVVGAVPGVDLLITGLPDQLPQSAVRIPEVGTLVVTAEQPVLRHTGRLVGRLEVTLGSDGSLSGETWSTTWMAKTIADDPEMAALLAGYQK